MAVLGKVMVSGYIEFQLFILFVVRICSSGGAHADSQYLA